jgi:hypothetical protein
MIKPRPVRFEQRSAGNETILLRTRASDYDYTVVYLVSNRNANEEYLLPRLDQRYQPTQAARKSVPNRRAAYSAPAHITLPTSTQESMLANLKEQNIEHWANQLFGATTDCIQLPAIKPHPSKPFTIDLTQSTTK